LTESEITLSAEIVETDEGFVIELYARGAGLNTAPFTVNAIALAKDAEAIAGNYPDVRVGDTITGTGIAADTKVVAVDSEQVQLSKAVSVNGDNVTLTVTPPKGVVQLCDIPMRIMAAMDPVLGTVFEVSSALKLSTGEQLLGQARLVVDAELSYQRIARK
jgi:hypothetical protein